VWSLDYAFHGVLPIHWSATVPVLEFPVDLLFYNFVMPLAIRSLKPSDGLHSLYNWWFRKCARFLRLSNFFFGDTERRRDEEGYHFRTTWWDVLSWKQGDVERPVTSEEQLADQKETVCFVRDGKFVRAPASDQVRIPKGSQVFLEVTEDNKRVDGAPDRRDGLHGRASDMFAKVYIPPYFRTRIAAFILLIWVFAAASGVGVTIIPLVIGRKLTSSYFSKSVPVNDVYAFSTGLCIVGGSVCAVLYFRTALHEVKDYLRPYLQSPREACLGLSSALLNVCRLAFVFTAFCVLLPSIFALLMELYVLVPMHTHFGSSKGHVIHFVQDWTLGVLYTQMAIKFVQWNSASRPAAALDSVFRDGWLRPNASLATRALVLPISLLAGAAVAMPLFVGFALNSTVFYSVPEVQFKVYRYTYPVTLLIGLSAWAVYMVRRRVELWRVNIRDDVYLIGERLHNFSEKRARDVGVPRRVITG
jgi:E3 ubiquitin-protein ligase MARCH6